ncbi:MAG: UDP-N-acetylglucosamine 1-carboxyvinyltransferase [Clostridia bacterium]|nr:UDP-N-acetylglucosamine 1-carboxyvinyltransferase [Clostridia bacterium]
MSYFAVKGGTKLIGSVNINGAKNSVLPILAATLLNAGENVIHNCTRLRDVDSAIKILKHLGCRITRQGTTLTVDSSNITRCDVPESLMREMRSSVIFLGPILARCGCVRLSTPGGCELGPRPIGLHLDALRKLGATVSLDGGEILCRSGNMRGRDIVLGFPSVGATENIMLAATACRGTTRIINAAREPEIEDLQNFLLKTGAAVCGAGRSEITITGGKTSRPTEHTVMPDRIEAATYLCAAAACRGHIELRDIRPQHIATVISILSDAGCDIKTEADRVIIRSERPISGMPTVQTMPYPGFPTDAQSQLMAAACLARGTTVFYENIFENRFRQTGELCRMGARIKVSGRTAVVEGVDRLTGALVRCTDLRGGAALVIAALAAEGESKIYDIEHIDRGYESIENGYSSLGGNIKRKEE